MPKRSRPRWKRIRWKRVARRAAMILMVLGVVVALVAGGYLVWTWSEQAGEELDLEAGELDPATELRFKVRQLEHERLAMGAQLLLALAVLAGVWLTFKRVRAMERQADTAQRQEITERFTKAIEQLGNREMSIRLGGIYALEKIAQDEPEAYFNQFREVLSAFVRETAREPHLDEDGERSMSLPTDLQTALTVLGRNPPPDEVDDPARIDWSSSHLEGAQLNRADLEGTDLLEADLEGAYLEGAHLKRAQLMLADLEGAHLAEAHLEGADLWRAHLKGADLGKAHLEGAHLEGTHLEGASLYNAHLGGADLGKAYLEDAYFRETHYDSQTRFPVVFEPSERGLILVGEDDGEGSDS